MPGYTQGYPSRSPREEQDYERNEKRKLKQARAKEKELKAACDALKSNPSTRNLLSAYNKFPKKHNWGFIVELKLLSGIGEDNPPQEFKGIEYETKLDLQITKRREATKPPQDLSALLRALQKGMSKDSNFLSEKYHFYRSSTNFYYGKGNKDMLVVMRGEDRTSLKYKEDLENLSVGLTGEEFIVKRKERVDRHCSEEDVIRETQEVILKGGRYQGRILRDRKRTDFVSISTGRIYTVVLDICEVFKEGQKPFKKRQIEAEYVGYIPNLFGGFRKRSEKQIAEDLLTLSHAIQKSLIGIKVKDTKIKDLQFTRERKYDFLVN